MLIYANRFYTCCHIILLSDDIGEVLLLLVLTAHQCWFVNSRGGTHLHSLHGLLDTAGSWGPPLSPFLMPLLAQLDIRSLERC